MSDTAPRERADGQCGADGRMSSGMMDAYSLVSLDDTPTLVGLVD